ncbi:MAG: arginase family protein [Desulfobacteraceae bacterium]|nr:MAG: arginase family protein [Desulfobacteraceae bacterium]
MRSKLKKVVFFGCALDCDEKHEAIEEKLSGRYSGPLVDDPLKPIIGMLAENTPRDQWRIGPSIPVPGWLRPIPPPEALAGITVENCIRFLDQDGCRQYATEVQNTVTSSILPDFPCLIAVDHALCGGAYTALAGHYGRKNLSLIVLDSHTDAVPMSRLANAILYDAETNPRSVHDRANPYLYDRTESYNASSFIHHLLADEVLDPRDLYIIGISDYPEKKAFRINDPRIAEYVEVYSALKRRGTTLITKHDFQMQPTKVKSLLKKIRTPYAYISIDMDIGARNAVEGVRFKNWQGLGEKQIYRLASMLCESGRNLELVGLDVTEINPRTAGRSLGDRVDRTYQIAANLISKLVFEQAV